LTKHLYLRIKILAYFLSKVKNKRGAQGDKPKYHCLIFSSVTSITAAEFSDDADRIAGVCCYFIDVLLLKK